MANVHAGYRGILDLGNGVKLRFVDAGISAKQAVEIPDMVMGDWDHDDYAYGKVEVGGSISGLVDENFQASIWDWGFCRDSCGLLTPKSPSLYYYCDSAGKRSQTFDTLYVNTLNFSCAAGDIANWSVDVIGKKASAFSETSPANVTDVYKLITWDKIGLVITPGSDMGTPTAVAFQNIEFSIANNVAPVYAIGDTTAMPLPDRLFPYEVVPGIRTITGSLTGFDIDDTFSGFGNWDAYDTGYGGLCTMAFAIGALNVSFRVRFHRIDPKMGVGPITSTIAFSGVGHQDQTGCA